MNMYLLFDIGGTRMRLACSTDGKTISEPIIGDTPADDFNAGIKQLVQTAAKVTNIGTLKAAAGGVPGPMDREKSMILNAPNLPGWNKKQLKRRLEEELSAQVFLENDTVMIGLGEATSGAGKGHAIVTYITISTGVGGARIVNGHIDENSLGFEPGHQIIDLEGPLCGCGGTGHLEALISGTAFKKKYNMHPKEVKDPEVWEQAAYHLAVGLNNILVMWSPDIILLGGPMMRDIPIDRVRYHFHRLVSIFDVLPSIEMMSLGEKAGLWGSLAYVQQKLDA